MIVTPFLLGQISFEELLMQIERVFLTEVFKEVAKELREQC